MAGILAVDTPRAQTPVQTGSPTGAYSQSRFPAQRRLSATEAPHLTPPTAETGQYPVQGETLQTGRPRRKPKPVVRYGVGEPEEENTIHEDTSKDKEKRLSPRQRKKRKNEARKRDKNMGEAWTMTPSENLIMKFKRLPGN